MGMENGKRGQGGMYIYALHHTTHTPPSTRNRKNLAGFSIKVRRGPDGGDIYNGFLIDGGAKTCPRFSPFFDCLGQVFCVFFQRKSVVRNE
jgi:hypothetical protein